MPTHTLRVLIRLAAGGQQTSVQAQQLRTAGVVIFLQPVGQDEVDGFIGGRFHDAPEEALKSLAGECHSLGPRKNKGLGLANLGP
jgi:hypothetical protein